MFTKIVITSIVNTIGDLKEGTVMKSEFIGD